MEVYEHINHYIRETKISKIEFYRRLVALEPKLTNTGEVPTTNAVYAYLIGRIGMRVELLPYVARVFNIPVGLLFGDTAYDRRLYIKHIKESLTQEERELFDSSTATQADLPTKPNYKIEYIKDMLQFAPDMFLGELADTLKDYKELTLKFRRTKA